MNNLLTLFANNIFPIFLAAGSGYLISKYLKVEPRPISQIAFYIFSPCLIFNLLTTNHISNDDMIRMVAFTTVIVMTVGVITWLVGRLLHFEHRLLIAIILTAMFGNTGNYGLSLNLFAFGEEGLAYASLYFVTTAILTYTVGVFIASLGTMSIKEALFSLLKIPAVYAVILALIFNILNWQLPLPVDRTVSLLSGAAIPVLMILLGIQLQHSKWDGKIIALSFSNMMKLVVAPIVAIIFSLLFSLEGPARQAAITESAMPTAVMMTVLATEFDVEPSFVTTVVFVSTLLSPLTVTPLLALLGA